MQSFAESRLLCLDFDRTIAKDRARYECSAAMLAFNAACTSCQEHMWGTYKDAPLNQIPVSEDRSENCGCDHIRNSC